MGRLDAEGERRYWAEWQAGSAPARRRLELAALGVVDLVVGRLSKAGKLPAEHRDDCYAEGALAVVEQLPRWKPELGMLSTFMLPRVQGAILDYLLLCNKAGVATLHAVRKDKGAITIMELEGAAPAASEEVEVRDAPGAHAGQQGGSRQDALTYGQLFVGDTPQQVDIAEAFAAPERAADQAAALEQVEKLPAIERKLLVLVFGLGDGPAVSVETAARMLGISRAFAYVVHDRALDALRESLDN